MNGIKNDWESLGISNDFLFGKVMRDPELCKGLLQRILPHLDIGHVEYPETQKSIWEDMDARSVCLNVYVKDGKKPDDAFVMELEEAVKEAKKTGNRGMSI